MQHIVSQSPHILSHPQRTILTTEAIGAGMPKPAADGTNYTAFDMAIIKGYCIKVMCFWMVESLNLVLRFFWPAVWSNNGLG